MKILTKAFGEVEIDPKDIIKIKTGIFGFPKYTKYIIMMIPEEEPFAWLQCVEEPNLAFVIIRPEVFKKNYRLKVDNEVLNTLSVKSVDELISYAIVVVPENLELMTANLQGPIVINPKTKEGVQAISLVEEYTVRHYILKEMNELKGQG
ncbi:MAG TPA: flagellar assembly protein FliW [bacterium]|nr:flagellar assembly protein FliW [bacterium]HOL46813.1 flagellar assembly protein FliW [bacterium]HPQ18661.1 flagellar assembly protein FliW [bacterium]